MIINFENITEDLTTQELNDIVPLLVRAFEKRTKENPVKAPFIVGSMNVYLKANGYDYKFSEVKLRKLVNYIRSNSILPIISTSKGYYVSYDKTEVTNQVESLSQRARQIFRSAGGLKKFISA